MLSAFATVLGASEREAAKGLYPELQFTAVASNEAPLQTAFNGLVQDHEGFLWISTLSGLLRFDGQQVKQWSYPADESAHGGPTHGQLTLSADGSLWLLSPQGPLRLPPGREGFQRVPMPVSDAARWPWRLQTGGGEVWLVNAIGGVFRYLAAEKRFAPVFEAPGGEGSAVLQPDAHVDPEGALWLVHAGQVWRVRPEGAQSLYRHTSAAPTTRSLMDPQRHRICTPFPDRLVCLDADGRQWAISDTPAGGCGYGAVLPDGHFLFHCGRQLYQQLADGSALRRVPIDAPLEDATETRMLIVDSQGLIWLDERVGLRLIDPASGHNRLLTPENTAGMLAAGGGQAHLMEDNQQGMWVAEIGKGVMRASLREPLFRHWAPPAAVSAHIRALWQDDASAQTHWFTTFDKLLWRLRWTAEGQAREARSYALPAQAVWDERAGFARDAQGRLWFATAHQIWRVDEDRGGLTAQRVPWPKSLKRPLVGGLHRGTDGGLWLYGNFGLARQPDARTPDWQFFPLPASVTKGMPEDFYIDRLHVGSDGRWWIVSERGLLVFDPVQHQWQHIHSRNSALATDWVQGIRESPVGTYWLGLRNGGVQRFQGRAEQAGEVGRWQRWGAEQGLTDVMVYDVLPESGGVLWLAGGQGVTRFDPAAQQFQHFFRAEGLRQQDFNRSQSLPGPGGTLLLGGLNGLTVINPEALRESSLAPKPLLTGVAWNRGALTPENGRVTVPHEGADVTVSYIGLHYDAPTQVRYRYRLQADAPWVSADTTPRAQLAGIGAGEYVFEVQASISEGQWSDSLRLALSVPPPWWRTWPFVSGVGALLLLLAWGWKRQRDYRQAQLETEVADRTRDLADANQSLLKRHEVIDAQAQALGQAVQARDQLFARVSHEFRTPLSLIQLALDALRKEPDPRQAQQDIALGEQHVQELADMVDQLLLLARGQATEAAPMLCDVRKTVEAKVMALQPAAHHAGVSLRLGAVPACETPLSPQTLDTVLNNLIGNALKYTPAGGSVQVWMTAEDELVVHVKDSGVGIAADFLPQVFAPFARAPDAARSKVPGVGLGLHLVDLLVRKDKGRVEVDSREGEGSHFRVIFPLQHLDEHTLPAQSPTSLIAAHPELRDKPDRGAPPGMRVLVIEDNDALRARLQRLLETDYRVHTAADGDAGLTLTRETLPDLILCDVDLPRRDGFSVCAELKDDPLTAGIPVFFLTAFVGSDHRLMGLKAQGDAYFCKPFVADELKLHIANRLWQQQRLREQMQREFSGGEKVTALAVVATRDETQLAKARALHEKVQKLLAKNFAHNEYNVAALAADLHQDPRHLQRLFAVYAFGMTPKQMLTRYRLAQAYALLQESRPVGKVAEACGLDPKHFFAAFKAQYGMLPGEVAERRDRA